MFLWVFWLVFVGDFVFFARSRDLRLLEFELILSLDLANFYFYLSKDLSFFLALFFFYAIGLS